MPLRRRPESVTGFDLEDLVIGNGSALGDLVPLDRAPKPRPAARHRP